MIRDCLWAALVPLALCGALRPPLAAEEVRVRVGEPYPSLVLPALADGAPASLEQFRGRKVLLHQFASW